MKLEYLEEFVVLTETMNYEQAAFRLYTSQSTLSRHIQSIEEELGSPLFVSGSSGSVLTDLGRTFLEYAKSHVELDKKFRYIQDNMPSGAPSSILRIGFNEHIKPYHVFDAIINFKRSHPQSAVVQLDNSVRDLLIRKTLDMAIVFESSQSNIAYSRILLSPEQFAVAVYEDHPLAGKSRISIKELKNEHFLALQHRCILTYLSKSFCLGNGFSQNIIMTLPNCYSLLNMVDRGCGIAILPKKVIERVASDTTRIVLLEENFELNINLLYDKNKSLSNEEEELIHELIMEVSK